MRSAFAIATVAPAFTTTIGTTPVTFEPRDGRWRAICGARGFVEIWGLSYREVRRDVESIYLGSVHVSESAA